MIGIIIKTINFFTRSSRKKLTRVEVLKHAKHYNNLGLCYAIKSSIKSYTGYRIRCNDIKEIFSKFDRNIAIEHFGAEKEGAYWWFCSDWSTGRKSFLNSLIKEYKNDTENILPFIKVLSEEL